MHYYLIAGEASGDLHGSNLIKAIRLQDTEAQIRCWGGDLMEKAGGVVAKHYRDLAFMGFVEVILHLKTIINNIDYCKKDIINFKPDVVVLIDYPGFNMHIASWAKYSNLRVVYYISPQVWAWKENRVKVLKRNVDKMLVILPFEVDFYKKWDFNVTYVGHPLIEVISNERQNVPVTNYTDKPVIALLPGSRAQEIKVKLPEMLKMVQHFPDYVFIVAQASAIPDDFYKKIIDNKQVLLVKDQTYNILKQATAALVTSGTATLETALFAVPQVVCYKGNSFSFWLAKKLVKVKYISIVNLIMEKLVITELIQNDLNEQNILTALKKILYNNEHKTNLLKDYAELWAKLGKAKASENAAREIIEVCKAIH